MMNIIEKKTPRYMDSNMCLYWAHSSKEKKKISHFAKFDISSFPSTNDLLIILASILLDFTLGLLILLSVKDVVFPLKERPKLFIVTNFMDRSRF